MVKTFTRQWFNEYYKISFDTDIWDLPKGERLKSFQEEYKAHKFRAGEKYDKYLDKLLFKYDLELQDYRDCYI